MFSLAQNDVDLRSNHAVSFRTQIKKSKPLASGAKGQFCKNTVYLERGMPCFAFVNTNAVLVRKIDEV